MEQSNISIRINKSLKDKFDNICEELGLTMSTALNIFIKTVVREEGIPLRMSLHVPNKETIKAIEEAEKGKIIGPFDTTEELMESLLEDNE